MALDNFIPEIWAANLLSNLNKAHVYGQAGVVNRDYEGDISSAGDTVHINSIGRVTIGDYTKNTNISDPETLTSTGQTLLIDQQKYFNFAIDDVDRAQTKPKVMSEAMAESAYGLGDASDQFLASFYSDADSGNLIGNDTTPISVTDPSDAYEELVDLGTLLTEANVPLTGRWAIIPPWFYGLAQKDDRFVKSGAESAATTLRTGQIGEAAGFTVMQSNNVPNTSAAKYKIQAGHQIALSYAEQIVSTEAYRPEKRFGDAVKGLHVYGGKLVRPTALAVLTANKS